MSCFYSLDFVKKEKGKGKGHSPLSAYNSKEQSRSRQPLFSMFNKYFRVIRRTATEQMLFVIGILES